MFTAKWPKKDPEEVLDYSVDWTARLDGDPITDCTATLLTAAGVTVDLVSNTATTSTVWLSGGTIGQTALIKFHIVTAAYREMERTISVRIEAK
jgi:hypothetical protein